MEGGRLWNYCQADSIENSTLQQAVVTAVNDVWARKDAILLELQENIRSVLDEQIQAVTEYSEVLVRRLIERITVFDELLVIEFKSGLEVEVEV